MAKSGKPLVKVTALDAPAARRRLAFLAGEIAAPEDFNDMGAAEIAALFGFEGEAAPQRSAESRPSARIPRSRSG